MPLPLVLAASAFTRVFDALWAGTQSNKLGPNGPWVPACAGTSGGQGPVRTNSSNS
jgi:hypothetical protein